MVYCGRHELGQFVHGVSSREGYDLHGGDLYKVEAPLLELHVHELEHHEETIGND